MKRYLVYLSSLVMGLILAFALQMSLASSHAKAAQDDFDASSYENCEDCMEGAALAKQVCYANAQQETSPKARNAARLQCRIAHKQNKASCSETFGDCEDDDTTSDSE